MIWARMGTVALTVVSSAMVVPNSKYFIVYVHYLGLLWVRNSEDFFVYIRYLGISSLFRAEDEGRGAGGGSVT